MLRVFFSYIEVSFKCLAVLALQLDILYLIDKYFRKSSLPTERNKEMRNNKNIVIRR